MRFLVFVCAVSALTIMLSCSSNEGIVDTEDKASDNTQVAADNNDSSLATDTNSHTNENTTQQDETTDAFSSETETPFNDSDAETTDTLPEGNETPDDTIMAGELLIEQIYLPGMNMGEAILIIGPDNTSVLIDTANDGHGPQLLEAVQRRTGGKAIDWAIMTHYHNDHIGGFDNLFGKGAAQAIEVKKGIVTRGMFDIGADMPGVEDFNEFCTLLTGELATKAVNLCSGTPMTCGGGSGGPWSATDCPGLLKGNLTDPADDAAKALSYIPLGNGAKLYLTHANGWVAQNGTTISAEKSGITIGWGETDQENGRSLGGVVKWGDFRYVFAGDTQGRDIKIEGFIASHRQDLVITPGGEELIPAGSSDAAHLSHHGLASSTSQDWVDFLFPADGKNRNAIVGTTGIYVTSPAQEVLDRLVPRLGTGSVWANAKAWTSGKSNKLIVANAAVTLKIIQGGSAYQVITGTGSSAVTSQAFSAADH